MTTAALTKENISLGLAYSFRALVQSLHDGIQADMVLEKELRVLHPDPQAAEAPVCHTGHSLSI